MYRRSWNMVACVLLGFVTACSGARGGPTTAERYNDRLIVDQYPYPVFGPDLQERAGPDTAYEAATALIIRSSGGPLRPGESDLVDEWAVAVTDSYDPSEQVFSMGGLPIEISAEFGLLSLERAFEAWNLESARLPDATVEDALSASRRAHTEGIANESPDLSLLAAYSALHDTYPDMSEPVAVGAMGSTCTDEAGEDAIESDLYIALVLHVALSTDTANCIDWVSPFAEKEASGVLGRLDGGDALGAEDGFVAGVLATGEFLDQAKNRIIQEQVAESISSDRGFLNADPVAVANWLLLTGSSLRVDRDYSEALSLYARGVFREPIQRDPTEFVLLDQLLRMSEEAESEQEFLAHVDASSADLDNTELLLLAVQLSSEDLLWRMNSGLEVEITSDRVLAGALMAIVTWPEAACDKFGSVEAADGLEGATFYGLAHASVCNDGADTSADAERLFQNRIQSYEGAQFVPREKLAELTHAMCIMMPEYDVRSLLSSVLDDKSLIPAELGNGPEALYTDWATWILRASLENGCRGLQSLLPAA